MVKTDKLKQRVQIKKRKPQFKRAQSHQFPKLNDGKWRKPKGMGHKVRRNRRGKPSMPTVGYGSPNEFKGANRDGLFEVIVNKSADLATIDTKTQIATIGASVGAKKRLEILAEAKKKNMNVSNYKNIDDALKSLQKEKKAKAPKKETAPAKEEKKEAKTDSKAAPKKEAKKEDSKK